MQGVNVDTLVALWHGDSQCAGYMHPELVVAVCEQLRPANLDIIRVRFYPTVSKAEIDRDAMMILEEGYDRWQVRGCRTRPIVTA